MTAPEYKKLCRRVYGMYKDILNMSYFEACECVDDVYFGNMTEAELMQSVDDMATDELATT